MSTGNSHPRNSSDERRLYNDLDARDRVRCPVCHLKWLPDDENDTDIHPVNDTCYRYKPTPIDMGATDPVGARTGPDLRRDPDQPTIPNAGHPLDRELASYRRMLPQLFRNYPGQWVVMKGETGVLIRPTFGDALKAGYECFGLDGFLVKQITEHEPVLRGSVAWLAERDHLAGEVERLNAEAATLRADNAQLADSLASANERMTLLQDIREAQAASIAKYRGELDASRAEVEALTVERDGLLAQLAEAADRLPCERDAPDREDVRRTRERIEQLVLIHNRQVDELGRFEHAVGLIRAALDAAPWRARPGDVEDARGS